MKNLSRSLESSGSLHYGELRPDASFINVCPFGYHAHPKGEISYLGEWRPEKQPRRTLNVTGGQALKKRRDRLREEKEHPDDDAGGPLLP